jgi:hypothetical protein
MPLARITASRRLRIGHCVPLPWADCLSLQNDSVSSSLSQEKKLNFHNVLAVF